MSAIKRSPRTRPPTQYLCLIRYCTAATRMDDVRVTLYDRRDVIGLSTQGVAAAAKKSGVIVKSPT